MEVNENMIEMTNNKRKSEKGVTAAEYAVMLFLVAIAIITAGTSLPQGITGVLNNLATKLQ